MNGNSYDNDKSGNTINANRREFIKFVVAGAVLDPEHWPPLVGGGVAGVALWLQYRHALQAGTEGGGESTEDYLPWQNQ